MLHSARSLLLGLVILAAAPASANAVEYRLLGDAYARLVNGEKTDGTLGVGFGWSSDIQDGVVSLHWGSVSQISQDPKQAANFILTPGTSDYSWAARVRVPFYQPLPWLQLGPDAFTEGGRVNWVVHDPASEDPATTLEKEANAYGYGVGGVVKLIPPGLKENDFRIFASALATRRLLGGSARTRDFRSLMLQSTDGSAPGRDANGVQLEVEAWLNDVFFRVSGSFLSGNIEGLSGGQWFVTAGVRSGVKLK